MNWILFFAGLSIAGLSLFNGHLTHVSRWFNALPGQSKADIVLIVVCVAGLGAWGLT